MHHTIHKIILCCTIGLLFSLVNLNAASVTITSPATGAIISGATVPIFGTASTNPATVRLAINTTLVASVAVALDNSWSFTLSNLDNGLYSASAQLMNASFATLASTINTFTVQNPPYIKIISPVENETILSNISSAYGTSSLSFAPVNITINSYVTTTTTDADGNWQAEYNTNGGGQQTLFAELIQNNSVVASESVTIIPNTPLVFPITVAQSILVRGTIPTSSAGSGPGYSFVSTSTSAAITFDETFPETPTVTATGESSSVFSAVSLSWVSTTSVNLFCTLGTDRIHFSAALLM